MTTTTIKVDSATRDLLKQQAGREGLTLGEYLHRLAEQGAKRERFEMLRSAIAATPAELMASWQAEAEQWERVDGGR